MFEFLVILVAALYHQHQKEVRRRDEIARYNELNNRGLATQAEEARRKVEQRFNRLNIKTTCRSYGNLPYLFCAILP